MELLSILLFLVFLASLFYMSSAERRRETVYETSGMHAEEAQARYAYLQANGIRCRLRTITSAGIQEVNSPAMISTVRVEVSKKDRNKAYELLSKYK